jgi:multimeric flavodoxin WrbA
MKILAIQSSPNLNGLTANTSKAVLTGPEDAGAETDLVHLNELKLEHCKACNGGWGQCRTMGTCILEDNFQNLLGKINQTDVITFSTPVYWHDLSESAKIFLDRLRRVETGRGFSSFKGKKAIGIAVAGGSGRGACRALYLLEDYLRRLNFEIFDMVTVTRTSMKHKLKMLNEAGKLISKNTSDT